MNDCIINASLFVKRTCSLLVVCALAASNHPVQPDGRVAAGPVPRRRIGSHYRPSARSEADIQTKDSKQLDRSQLRGFARASLFKLIFAGGCKAGGLWSLTCRRSSLIGRGEPLDGVEGHGPSPASAKLAAGLSV